MAAVRAFQEKLQAVRTDDPVMARLRGNLAGLLEEQDPSLSIPFLRKQESTVRDSRLRGNGDGADSYLRGNGNTADSHLRGNGDGADFTLAREWRRGGFHTCAGMATGWIHTCAGMATGWIHTCAGMATGADSHLRGNGGNGAQNLAQLEQSLLASLPGRLDALNASLYADYISLENLPAQLKQLWLSADGKRRIEIYPKQDMQDNAALREFVHEIQSHHSPGHRFAG